MELPTINYARFNGQPYKYVYGVSYNKRPYSVVKLNVSDPSAAICEQRYEPQDKEDDYLPGEPVFVESPNAQSEDDGVVLVLVLAKQRDYLSILDAKDMSEIARAEMPADTKGAYTFHGFFADNKNFSKLDV